MRSPSIKKVLREAGLFIPSMEGFYEISSREIEVFVDQPETWVEEIEDYVDAQAEFEAAVDEALTNAGYKLYGRRTGWNAVVYTDRKPRNMGDWNDKSSAWHY